MSGPRFRVHADGRIVIHTPSRWAQDRWELIHGYDNSYCDGYTDAEVHGEGWSEAALVELLEPEDVQPHAEQETRAARPDSKERPA